MEKRFILAIVLCTLIYVFGTQYLLPQPKPRPQQPDEVSQQDNPETGDGKTPGSGTPTGEVRTPEPSELPEFDIVESTLRDEHVELQLTSRGGSLSAATLSKFQENDHKSALALFDGRILETPGLETDGSQNALSLEINGYEGVSSRAWKLVSSDDQSVRYELPLGGEKLVRKTIRLDGSGQAYLAHVDLEFVGMSGEKYRLFGPQRFRFDIGSRQGNQRVVGLSDGTEGFSEAERESLEIIETAGEKRDVRPMVWAGIESNYFAFVLRPEFNETGSLVERSPAAENMSGSVSKLNEAGIQGLPYRVGFERTVPAAGIHTFEIFLGPKDRGLLAAHSDQGYDELVYFGSILGPLVRLFLWLLGFFNGIFGSFGIAIICLTVCVKVMLHPLNKRNQGMMQRQQKKMAKIQPKLNKAREQHKNDPVRANQEMQRLMKENDVNPAAMFGGCLLILLQLPIWIGLINTFSLAAELRHEGFLWFADLTQPDMLFSWGVSIPFLGEYLNLLPVLYVCVTLVHQRMMPKSADPNMAQQQKIMTFMMVLLRVHSFYSFPSGLLLYFLTSSSLGIIEQKIIRAELKREEEALEAAKA